jgi:tetratricopeptide (TPR) repeat protein
MHTAAASTLIPMQRLLQRNQQAIASAQAAAERASLLAQRVLLLARHWRMDDVPAALSDAEAAVAASADRRAAAELALARGVARYYGAQIGSALEPVREARDAAILLGDAGLEAECEAWLGCVRGTLHHDPDEVLPHLRQAVRLGSAQRPLAAARGLYVVATLYHEADLIDEAVRHYRRASSVARAEHDEQLVAAVHRYMTLAQAQQVRRARAAGRLDDEQLKQALAGLGSAQQLAAALTIDDTGLQSNLRLGEMLRLSSQYAQAVAVFERTVEPAVLAGMTWEATIARADQAVCLAHCGRLEAAERTGQLAEIDLSGEFDDYSRAVVYDSLAELAGMLDREAQARAYRDIAAAAWELDVAYCSGLRAALTAHGPLTA